MRQLISFVLPISLGVIIWFLPPPVGVEPSAWQLFAIFLATVVGFVTKPMTQGTIAIIAIVVIVLSNTLTIEEGLSGFSHTTSWLTCSSFLIARAIIKTGLAMRIAYYFMSMWGGNTLLLSYGLLATDLMLSPAMPSGNARAGGVIFPLVKSLATVYKSEPYDGTRGRIGSFLMATAYQGTQITTAMFLTAMVANPLMAQLAREMGLKIDWATWALAALVPGVTSLLMMPLIVYLFFPPEIKHTPEAPYIARKQLAYMGNVSQQEWLMVITILILLFLWCFGNQLGGIKSATTALIGVALLLSTRVLTWSDVVEERKTWDIFIWFSTLLMMATFLDQLGFIPWLSYALGDLIQGLSWQWAFVLLGIVYFYGNYFFASKAARAGAMYPAFLSVAISLGTPPMYAALSLAFLVNLSGCLTHYATAEAPIYYGAGYIDASTWFKLGGILSLVYLFVWLIIGGFWWRLLGLI
ncbi:MAG: DASS family sodium-coupled anion symporter [Xenococcaceae cyanobacterium MO_207.B15]|nr:DASS family sodium-coupled anion symporter [Xenococcaceae cyanobacterium MO_207.B15]